MVIEPVVLPVTVALKAFTVPLIVELCNCRVCVRRNPLITEEPFVVTFPVVVCITIGLVVVRVLPWSVRDPPLPIMRATLALTSRVISPPMLVTVNPAPGIQCPETPVPAQSQLLALPQFPTVVFQLAVCADAPPHRRRKARE